MPKETTEGETALNRPEEEEAVEIAAGSAGAPVVAAGSEAPAAGNGAAVALPDGDDALVKGPECAGVPTAADERPAADEPPVVEAPAASTDADEGPTEAEPVLAHEDDGPDTVQPPAAKAPAVATEGGEGPAEAEAIPAVVEAGPAVAEPPAAGAPAAAVDEDEGPAADVAASAAAEGEGTAAEEWPAPGAVAALEAQSQKRRRLLVVLGALVVLLIGMGAIFGRYLWRPGPLPELLPLPVDLNYRPHYLFSIHGPERPVGVAVSPDGERIYVTEAGGEREVKVLDRHGSLLDSFAPPHTEPSERAPVYVAVDPAGRVFVTDRLQRAVFVYGPDGTMLDAILGSDLTLSEYLCQEVEGVQPDDVLAYNRFEGTVHYQQAGRGEQVLPAPEATGWAPLGVRLDGQGTMLLTNVAEEQHAVREFAGDRILAATWQEFGPPELVFGAQGQGSEELLFPNSAVADSQGRIYVTDGNNGRISVWDAHGTFLFTFGRGAGEGALSLPRGAAMDGRDRLHVVDAVQQSVKVYDVSGPEPRFLYAFGDWGTDDGQFNFPGDIALDATGRLYVADRENDRIQVWSY